MHAILDDIVEHIDDFYSIRKTTHPNIVYDEKNGEYIVDANLFGTECKIFVYEDGEKGLQKADAIYTAIVDYWHIRQLPCRW